MLLKNVVFDLYSIQMDKNKEKLVKEFADGDHRLEQIIHALDDVITANIPNNFVVREVRLYLQPTERDDFIDGLGLGYEDTI